ncbi:hypothetical protein H0H92_015948 [Tricholoma furcatifolium]|nr:hypothetical protein H0H92_015948 [Tricholoma furcatifolium]
MVKDEKTPESSNGSFPTINPDTTVANTLTSSLDVDVEKTSGSTSALSLDPFQLKNGMLTEQEISSMRHRAKKGKVIERYHRRQNSLITSLLKPMEAHTNEARMEEDDARLPVKIAVYASLVANFCLAVLQMYGAISASSLSLLATGIDAVFDISSNVVLFGIHKKAERLDVNKWPVGGARLETIGNVIYGFLMGSVNLVVIVESIRSIIDKNDDKKFHLPSIIAVSVALGILISSCFNKPHLSLPGLLMSAGGSKWKWYLDPLGAIIISFGVIIAWGRTIHGEFELLAGKSAPHDFLQLLIYKAATFSPDIVKVDTVRAYHSGPDYFVEIDVVMDANTPLFKAHDLSQQLQDKIEVLPNVERAFVHVDHETTHIPVRA